MAGFDVSTTGSALAPGSPAWFDAMAGAGYTVSPDMPSFVIAGYPPIYSDPEPDRPPPVTPNPAPSGSPGTGSGAGSSPTPSANRVPPPGTTGLPNSGMPTIPGGPPGNNNTWIIPDLDPLRDVAGRIRDAVGGLLGAVFDGISAVVGRLSGTVRDLAQAVLPTIEELATAIASTATGALSFLADNLTDMADFGATLAGALVEPLYALLDAGGEKVRDWLLGLLRALTVALTRIQQQLLGSLDLVRLI